MRRTAMYDDYSTHEQSRAGHADTELRSQLEYPDCPLCGGQESRSLLVGRDDWNPQGPAKELRFHIQRCNCCGACFTSPRFRERWKHVPFQGDYPFYERARARGADRPLTACKMQPFVRRARILQQAHPGPGSVLDLGMGDGAFLAVMRARGWSVSGIDNEPDVVAYARKQVGAESCSCGDIEEDPLPGGPFDAVTMWGVLQLVYRPVSLLEKVRRVLKPGGVICIGVSNFAGAGPRLFRDHWRGLGLPRHLLHFEPQTLRRVVKQAGYGVQRISFETPNWIVEPSVRAMLPLPRLVGSIVRRCFSVTLGLIGWTRLGDTMVLVARAQL